MNLQKRLAEITQAFESGDTPQETINVLNGNIEKLLAANVSNNALQVGDLAPLESTVFSHSETVLLRNLLNRKFLILTWFRGNW